jgi:hypothetical protein
VANDPDTKKIRAAADGTILCQHLLFSPFWLHKYLVFFAAKGTLVCLNHIHISK